MPLSVPFTANISTKLTAANWHYAEIYSYTKFHSDRSRNVESTGQNLNYAVYVKHVCHCEGFQETRQLLVKNSYTEFHDDPADGLGPIHIMRHVSVPSWNVTVQ
jgi:hypothetical protein